MDRSPTAAARRRGALVLVAAGVLGFGVVAPGSATPEPTAVPPDGTTVTYGATQITPPPPAGSFAGSAGGDGYDLGFWDGKVYNVFHHQGEFIVQCHDTQTAVRCTGYPKTVRETGSNSHFTASNLSAVHVEDGFLYGFTSRVSDLTPGVVKVDLATSDANPFHDFIPLGGAGDAKTEFIGSSSPALIGTKWYAFNLVPDTAASGAKNAFLCFDLATGAGCAGQPFALPGATSFPSGPWTGVWTPASMTQFGARLLVALPDSVGSHAGKVYCYDTSTSGACGGSWPITPTGGSVSLLPAGVPVLDATGAEVGTCLLVYDETRSSVWKAPYCVDADGVHLAAASAAIGDDVTGTWSTPFNDRPVVIGRRVWFAQGGEHRVLADRLKSQVTCFDWGTDEPCVGFARAWDKSDVELIYTVRPTPGNPTCLWINSDKGNTQITNFDAYTGGPCGEGGTRILMRSFVEPVDSCLPTKYLSLELLAPVPGDGQGGDWTVTFQDEDGQPLAGLADLPIVDGMVDLSSFGLLTASGLPQMLVDLPGVQTESIEMTILWEGPYYDDCVAGGQEFSWEPRADCDLTGSRTLSQGGWSNRSRSSPLTDAWFDAEVGADLVIGGTTNSVTLTSAAAARAFLPQSGTPSGIAGGHWVDMTARQLRNTLAGQVAALSLNLAWSPQLADATLVTGYDGTVAGLLDEANAALDGTGASTRSALSALTAAVERVNLSFPDGVDQGALVCPVEG